MTVLFIILTFAIIITTQIVMKKLRERNLREVAAPSMENINLGFNVEDFVVPAGLFFYKGHTWANVTESGEIKVGLSDFGQKLFTNIDRLELHQSGEDIGQGDHAFVVKQGDKEVEFHAPISGKISSINKKLLENPSLLKKSPYEDGWIYKMKPQSLSKEIRRLRVAEDARKWIIAEVQRLKEFLMGEYSEGRLLQNTMADGGIPVDGIINFLNDSSIKRMQSQFLR
ncbi:hypothetical protein GF337_13750 [candidate division KSB1 bacterium]|nr:hypothetical protein [candidate division KSB1 bacterium]